MVKRGVVPGLVRALHAMLRARAKHDASIKHLLACLAELAALDPEFAQTVRTGTLCKIKNQEKRGKKRKKEDDDEKKKR